MRPFFTEQRRWPAGFTQPHVYVLPDLAASTAFTELLNRTRGVLAGSPVSLIPDKWLHATVQPLDGIRSADLSAVQRRDLGTALTDQLAGVSAFTLTAGPALAGDSGVVFDLDGDLSGQPWVAVTTATRAAITQILGSAAAASRPGPPHLSLGYGIGEADSGALQSRLRREVRPSRAPLAVTAVHLVDVEQDPETATYRWRVWERIPLAG